MNSSDERQSPSPQTELSSIPNGHFVQFIRELKASITLIRQQRSLITENSGEPQASGDWMDQELNTDTDYRSSKQHIKGSQLHLALEED